MYIVIIFRQWRPGKGVHFVVQCTAVPAPPHPVYHPAAQHQYERSGGGGGTRNTATALAKAGPPTIAAPAAFAELNGGPREGPDGHDTLSDTNGSCPIARSADWF